MKNLLTYFVNEDKFDLDQYLDSSLQFKRSRMPQLPEDKFDTFLLHLANKYSVKRIELPAQSLKPTQGELDMSKAKNKAIKFSRPGAIRPAFIASKDCRIADGHHAHAGLLINNDKKPVVVYKTNLSAPKLIEVLNKMKHSFNVAEA